MSRAAGHPAPVLVRAEDGVELALWRAVPPGPPRRTAVVLVHGTFSNRNFFFGRGDRGLAHALAARGWDAWVPELRGHGRSGALGPKHEWRFEDWIRCDAPALVRGVLEHSGAERLVWIGHSAGGVIGAAFAGLGDPLAAKIAGLVAAGTPAPLGLSAPQRPLAALGWAIARIVGRFPARALRIGPEDEHAGIFGQWMSWNLEGRWLGTDGTDYFDGLSRVRVPVLALAGGGDRLVAPAAACRHLLDACGGDDRSFVLCGKAQGFRENYNHNRLLVSRGAQADVWPLIGDWMEKRFA